MKPILYESTETLFQSNGLGVLADCISAHVLEERNGQYEAEFEYPVDGIHYSDILEGRIILISHDESGDLQPFDIYGHSKTINGVTTFYAHHIAYRQNGITVKPFTATSLSQTLTKIKQNSVNTNPFNYSTDKSVSASFQLTSPKPLRSILGGEEGSLLDVYGTGEYEWDRFQVILHLHRGSDSGVVVRYGKNLISLQDDIDYSDSYNGIVPFWYGQNSPEDGEEAEETLVTLSEWVLNKTGSTYDGRNTVIPVDFSAQFQTIPTEAQLRTAAQSYLDRGNPLLPTDTLTFDFVELSKTEEYSYLALQQVNLCDTVTVVYDDINTAMKVISVDWDVLNERYRSLTLGDAPATYAQVITDRLATIAENANEGAKLAKLWATNALSIAGNTDQYFWFTSTGTDTGAHITQISKTAFLADPTHGGGNLLARSNGIAARDGLIELATFGANGSQIGVSTDRHIDITSSGIDFKTGATSKARIEDSMIRLGESGSTRVQVQSGTYNGLEVFDENSTSVTWLGTSSRIGDANDGHTNIYPTGTEIFKKDSENTPVSVAWFGENSRVGKMTEDHIEIISTHATLDPGIYIFNANDADSLAKFTAGGFRIGAINTECNIYADSTNGLTIYNAGQTLSYAQFKSGYARVGAIANTKTRMVIEDTGMTLIRRDGNGNDTNLAQILWGNTQGGGTLYDSMSFTFGQRNTNYYKGSQSLAEGYNNAASEFCAHAEGAENVASGNASHAEGQQNTASGNQAHAEGYDTTSSGRYSHSQNTGTIAQGYAQTAIGTFNTAQGTATSRVNTDHAFIIGNGSSNSARSNAFTVDWNGNAVASGTLKGSGWQGDLNVSGDVFIEGHDTSVGWYDAVSDSTTISNGTSFAPISTSSAVLALTPGRYIVTGSIRYDGNASGYRGLAFRVGTGVWDEGSILQQAPPSSSWKARLSSSLILDITANTSVYLCALQNSGSGLDAGWTLKAIRIR